MKKFDDLSLKVKLPLVVGFAGLFVFTVLCVILVFTERQQIYETVTKDVKLSTHLAAENLADYINSAGKVPRTYAFLTAAVIQSNDIPQREKRQRLLQELQIFADSEKQIDNLWAIFESNAVDGLDDIFADQIGNNSEGVFMPWMHEGKLRTMSDSRAKNLLDFIKTIGQECFSDPYLYNLSGKEEHFLSLCIPVKVDGRIVGVVGRDFSVALLEKIANSMNDTGRGRLVSSEGVIVVHANPARVGAIVGDGHQATLVELKKGKDFDLMVFFQGNHEYQAFSCIKLAECQKNWFFGISIPANEIFQPLRDKMAFLIVMAIFAIAFIALAGLVMIRWMLKDLKTINYTSEQVADGNLMITFDENILKKRDELGQFANSMSNMVSKIRNFVVEVKDSVDTIKDAGDTVNNSSQMLSEGASEQASSIEEVSSSMEEMSANIQQNTENAQNTNTIASRITEGVNKVTVAAQDNHRQIKEVSDKITIINEIASQTNILALNAAVEAARAGEHGRGFAVVASEVRKLAERSKSAADEIIALSNGAVNVVELAGGYLAETLPDIDKTIELVKEIASSSMEQNLGANQINSAIQQLNQVAQQNAASSEELASNATLLSQQADSLEKVVAFFRIEERQKKNIKTQNVQKNVPHKKEKPALSNKAVPSNKSMPAKEFVFKGFDSKDNDYEQF
ncbi:MAG: methyl-accepting chemotaxis protein [Marinilabiliaceae bacterium]|nr:methyl-accepting chemotaxis protein [Marinilabiliaceae bacterium]